MESYFSKTLLAQRGLCFHNPAFRPDMSLLSQKSDICSGLRVPSSKTRAYRPSPIYYSFPVNMSGRKYLPGTSRFKPSRKDKTTLIPLLSLLSNSPSIKKYPHAAVFLALRYTAQIPSPLSSYIPFGPTHS